MTRALSPPLPLSAAASAPPPPRRPVLGDPVVRVQLGLFALLGLLLAAGRPPAGLLYDSFGTLAAAVFLVVGLVGCRRAAARESEPAGRRHWNAMAVALLAWLAAEILLLTVDYERLVPGLLIDLSYLAFYLGFFLAIEVRRTSVRPDEPAPDLFDAAGVVLFSAFLLLEFVLLPVWLHRPAYDSWVPSQSLYVALDAVLVLRLGALEPRMPDRRWRRITQLLLGCAVLWLATDMTDMLVLLGWITVPLYTPLDLVWYIPFLLLALAGALPPARPESAPARQPRRTGSVVLYALLLPVLHLLHLLLGAPPPPLAQALQILTLVGIAMLGALALEQRRRLSRDYLRIAEHQAEVTKLLHAARESLEARVTRRTAELSQANLALQHEVRERRGKEEALLALEKALETTQVGVTIVDAEQRIVYVNPAEARMHGWSREELVGQPVQVFAAKSQRRPATPLDQLKMESWHRESVNRRRDGSEFPVLLRSDVVKDADGRPLRIVTTCEDITERKRTDAELRQSRERLRNLTSRLVAAREEERTRISRQVHDELGQTLTALKLDIAWLASRISSRDPGLARQAGSVSTLIDQTIAAVQDISADLRPVVLDEFGVAAAIEWQLEHYAERTGLRCGFEYDRGLSVGDRELATTTFRVFQELLTNVVRHAHARRVDVSLDRADGWLVLRVADDGVGISEEAVRDARSLGIIGVRERVQRLDGELTIGGAPGAGTVALVRFPEQRRE